MIIHYSIDEVAPYINWLYFDYAWGLSGKPDSQRSRLRREAANRLECYASDYRTHAVFQLFDCYSDGDDVVVSGGRHIPFLRQQQQGSEFQCLADYVAPESIPQTSSLTRKIGVFATSVDAGLEHDFDRDPYERMMMQLIGDRLAEATAERLHQQVRTTFWGYARDEHLSVADLLADRYQGIRPAVGYPSLPDVSLNFVLDSLLDLKQIGIRLTESGAMRPHASVSGLMLAHPKARYFSIGRIGDDQLGDYARRRGLPLELVRKFLSGNLC